MEEVDEFLDEIILDMEKLLEENKILTETVEELREEIVQHKKSETSVMSTLESAKKLMKDISESAEKRAERLDVAQPVLQREQRRSRADERREQLRELRVRRRFQRDQHEVARADFLRAPVREHGNDGRFPAVADFEAAAFPHGLVIAAQKEVSLMPRLREAYSVIGADGARSDNRNFHHARKLFF